MADAPETERKQRQPQRMTPDGLRAVAVRHLQRFPCSVAHLRRVLRRKITRSVRHYGDDEAPLLEAAEATIAALDGGALLDDARYAEALAHSLHRRGLSRRMIAQRLRHKGVQEHERAAALATISDAHDDPDLVAATHYARRRRLGPFARDPSIRAERRQKHLAALGRRGFSYGTARQVIDADDPSSLPG